jgi:hypothetical protein
VQPTDDLLDRDLADALHALDYPIERVSADVIIQRARARAVQRRWRFAAAAVVMLAASMAAALPGSPVRRWISQALRDTPAPASPRTQPTSAQVPDRVAEMRGVVTAIGRAAEVAFTDWQIAGEVAIRFIPESELRIRSSESPERYLVRPEGIRVRNPGSRASYELDVADRAEDVRVVANGRTIFERQGRRIVRGPSPRADGTYVVSLRTEDHR